MQVSVLDATRVKIKTNGYNSRLHQWIKYVIPARGRGWLPDDKAWWLDRRFLQDFQRVFPNVNLPDTVAPVEVPTAIVTTSFVTPNLKLQLFPFQQVAVEYVAGNRGRAIVGDEMGLGKTPVGVGVCAYYMDSRPAVIVCPKTMTTVWQDHVEKWLDGDTSCHIITGRKTYAYPKVSFYIIQWDLLAYHIDFLAQVAQIAIFDEAHRAANRRANRSEAASRLANSARICLPLTGTPMRNGPKDIWNLLNMVAPGEWPDFFPFAQRYCNAHQKEIRTKGGRRMVWDFNGASNQAELAIRLQGHMIRRRKIQVLKDLPEKYPPRQVNFVLSPIDRLQYAAVLRDTTMAIWEALERDGYLSGEVLVQMAALRRLAANLVLPQVIEWVEDFIEDDKIILFTHHREIADEIYEHFGDKAVKVVGGMPQSERKAAMDGFQNDPNKLVFVGNIAAAGEGLTLTAASTVLFVELPWTPADFDQCSDRAHRIGQNKAVSILVTNPVGTIYSDIWEVISSKREVIEGIVDLKSVQMMVARRLIQGLKREKSNPVHGLQGVTQPDS